MPCKKAPVKPAALILRHTSNNIDPCLPHAGDTLSGHFGSCLRFLVYQVSPTATRLVDIRDTMDAEFAPDKNLWRAQLIGDCHVCYVVSIGGPALEILAQFQQAMVNSPPPWLLKILGVAAEKRLKNYNAQGEEATVDE